MAKIELKDVSIDFPIYGSSMSFRTELLQIATGGLIRREGKKQRITVRGLDNINLTIRDGDRLAIVGHNGAGKTTLLKTLAGVYEPTQGDVTIVGRLSPMFNIAPGWDIEDTGFENIMNCGLFLGMSPDEIKQKTPEIAEVCGLGTYLHLPVRTYSAGMGVRLAFSIATAIDPEILLLDEGLGAGDESFAATARARVDRLLSRSRILVLASHSPELLETWCNTAILMEHGRITHRGPVKETLEVYRERNRSGAVLTPAAE
jgi:ABC-2 type transport system ATP-binding protein/lipopolysaccharide transport system ATP-binding protein